MDNFYYVRSYETNNSSVDVFFIDSQILYQGENKDNHWEYFVDKVRDVFQCDPEKVKRDQLAWLENSLKQSTADWKIVVGHYHLVSSGLYSTYRPYYNTLFPLFKKYNVNLYFCGHEHDIQYFEIKKDGYSLHQFICGSGSNIRHVRRNEHQKFAISAIGYYKCIIRGNQACVSLNNSFGKKLYNVVIEKGT